MANDTPYIEVNQLKYLNYSELRNLTPVYETKYLDPYQRANPSPLEDALEKFTEYGLPTVFTVGVLLNILSIIIFLNTELKKVSAFLYFTTFAVIDTVYLVTKMVHWGSRRIYDINTVAGICQINYYCHFLTTFLEWWMMVGMLGERVMVYYKPTTARAMCNTFRTKCILITVSIFAIVAHLYHTWTVAVIEIGGHNLCTIIPENLNDLMMLRKVDVFFSILLPVFVLAVLILLIVIRIIYLLLTKSRRRLQRNIRENRNNTAASIKSRRGSSQVQIQTTRTYLTFDPRRFTERYRLTAYCFLLVFIFLSICLPHEVLKIQSMFGSKYEIPTSEEQLTFNLFMEIYNINFAYKGLLYIVVIPEFRKAGYGLFMAMLSSIFRCKGKCNSEEMEHSYV